MSSSKPVLFLGSNCSISQLSDMAKQQGYDVKGILDSDYHGNTEHIDGVPVIGSELDVKSYKDDFRFFCAPNWMPTQDATAIRNREKRHRLIDSINELDLDMISLIDPTARLHSNTKLGRGVLIDWQTWIGPNVEVGDFSAVLGQTMVGHHTKIGRNCVIQRQISIAAYMNIEDEVYLSTACKLLKTGATIGSNTFVQECMVLRRGTVRNEVIGTNSKNKKRVYTPMPLLDNKRSIEYN